MIVFGPVARDLVPPRWVQVVLDGVPAGPHQATLLAMADVLRADARETQLLAGSAVFTAVQAERIAADLIRQGPQGCVLSRASSRLMNVGNTWSRPVIAKMRWTAAPGMTSTTSPPPACARLRALTRA